MCPISTILGPLVGWRQRRAPFVHMSIGLQRVVAWELHLILSQNLTKWGCCVSDIAPAWQTRHVIFKKLEHVGIPDLQPIPFVQEKKKKNQLQHVVWVGLIPGGSARTLTFKLFLGTIKFVTLVFSDYCYT